MSFYKEVRQHALTPKASLSQRLLTALFENH